MKIIRHLEKIIRHLEKIIRHIFFSKCRIIQNYFIQKPNQTYINDYQLHTTTRKSLEISNQLLVFVITI